MAVMTSSVDNVQLDLKANAAASADAMALDGEANGVHNVLFDEPESRPAEEKAPSATDVKPTPTVNGNHTTPEAPVSAPEPITNVSSGQEPVAPFLPDSQTDANSLFDGSELGATTIANAVEAPTSDVRDEAAPPALDTQVMDAPTEDQSNQSTQQVPETQLPSADAPDAMDVSQDPPAPPTSSADAAPTKNMNDLSIETQNPATSPAEPAPAPSPANADQDMEEAPLSGKVRSREDDDEEGAPEAKRTKTEEEESGKGEFKVPDLPAHAEQRTVNGTTPSAAPSALPTQSNVLDVQTAVGSEEWPTSPVTAAQKSFLQERLRNTKKIKVATAFKEPVDIVALNIPNYPEFVKQPMDLSTMETKLRTDQYPSVLHFMQDLDRIISNSIAFNGKDHPVTQAGYNMRAYFLKGMAKMPKAGMEEPVKQPKPKKPAVHTQKPRRESRAPSTSASAQSPVAPTPTATSPQTQAWPLQNNGTPLIRRDSSTTTDRPKREIHKPPPKDLPYNTAKPRKKKYQLELKFCEGVVAEIFKPKHYKFANPFLAPVDPVALNIPSYLKIIKKPMDFGTIEKNLKAGQYQTAKDFYNDAQLVFQNCFKFNPEGDEVNRMGKQLQELFDRLWKDKGEWLKIHAAPDEKDYAEAADSEDDEEEEEEEIDPAQAQILAIQEQIAKLNETAQSLLNQQSHKRVSPKAPTKKKAAKLAKKKGPLAVPPPPKSGKPKSRTKAPPPLSFAQKQEISEGISTLGDVEMRRAVQIIRNGCPHLSGVNDEEMEIDMDEIGDDTLRELFKFIKQVKGPKNAVLDDEYEPARVSKLSASRPKKNKPMGKQEQEDSIKRIQDQLRNFNEASGSGSSQSPPANQDESSDDESSGSESEEE